VSGSATIVVVPGVNGAGSVSLVGDSSVGQPRAASDLGSAQLV
jgi:hypothetical protein